MFFTILSLCCSQFINAIQPVNRESEDFQIVETYMKNTHAPTHSAYELKIVDVFKLDRYGENENFKSTIPNHTLLWHGSRLSNYAGILSQGLRIAPPEAPATGYMFGKAVYFADCVSKSANYCYTLNADGFLLLCEVALGQVQEEKRAKDIKRPKRGYNSVKGLGGTFPNPAESITAADGVNVPCGTLSQSTEKNLDLLYNEYMVYDVSQIKMKYLIRVNFNSTLL
jgi:hypothetical protein